MGPARHGSVQAALSAPGSGARRCPVDRQQLGVSRRDGTRHSCARAQPGPASAIGLIDLSDPGSPGAKPRAARSAAPAASCDAARYRSRPQSGWSSDISKLPTTRKGVYLNLYEILYLFARYPNAWMVSRKDNAALAQHLFRHALALHAIESGTLVVHQDRGAPMIAHSYRDFLDNHGIRRTCSRPRVSNDNPFSEAHFKTLKYSLAYPGRFEGIDPARDWLSDFMHGYSHLPMPGWPTSPRPRSLRAHRHRTRAAPGGSRRLPRQSPRRISRRPTHCGSTTAGGRHQTGRRRYPNSHSLYED